MLNFNLHVHMSSAIKTLYYRKKILKNVTKLLQSENNQNGWFT